MMKKLAILLAFLCSACSTNLGNFTVISNKIVDVKNFDLNKAPQTKHVTGTDEKYIIIFFPTGVPTLSAAMNDAFRNSDADLLTNASIEKSFFYIPYIFGRSAFTIEGNAVKTRGN